MSYTGRGTRRFRAAATAIFAIVALCAGGSTTAQADNLSVSNNFIGFDYSEYIYGTSSDSGTNKIRFSLFNNSGADVAPGSTVRLTPRPTGDPNLVPDPA